MWPMEATTSYPRPRYFLMVLPLAGLSTMTNFLPEPFLAAGFFAVLRLGFAAAFCTVLP